MMNKINIFYSNIIRNINPDRSKINNTLDPCLNKIIRSPLGPLGWCCDDTDLNIQFTGQFL